MDRIDFNPARATEVACLPGLDFDGAAISATEDKLLLAGKYTGQGKETCGLFEVPVLTK
jgi:hypothetical protein